MRRTTPIVLFLLTSSFVFAQKVAVKRVELAGQKIIVHYDLEDSNPNNEYQIFLYSSQNNYTTALTNVKGDVGNEVKPGSNHKIEWSITDELGPYKGKLSLEVRGRVFTPVAKINNIATGASFKRGKSHQVNWKPGNSNAINIELFKGGQRVSGELSQPNNGSFTLFIPEHASIGKDYTVKITDTRNSEDFVYSQPFTVKRKIPLLLKVIPVVAVGGVIAALAGGGGGGGGGPTDNSGEIPNPNFPGN
jgi:hypothetical protein